MLVVLAATDKEMHAALGHAGAPALEQGREVAFSTAGRDLLLCVTGVGLVNASLHAGRLLDRPGVDGVLVVGIAGAYNTGDFPLGSACFAWREIWPEYGLLDEDGGVDAEGIGFPQETLDGKPVWDRVDLNPTNDAERMGLHLGETWGRASSVTVSSVTGTPERAGWLSAAYTGDVENMEGFGPALAAVRQGVPFLELRTISNLVGSRAADEWDVGGALKGLGNAVRHLLSGA
ncbi:futalosine hydrolase [Pseudodesulfovibrio sp.]|uniref:futalosine hydrolase n=1 Tax=unclassified Pseudodesulfovibrio TaxID=2661612 RepID=UPI003AFF933E